jgi:hypothetical protein
LSTDSVGVVRICKQNHEGGKKHRLEFFSILLKICCYSQRTRIYLRVL